MNDAPPSPPPARLAPKGPLLTRGSRRRRDRLRELEQGIDPGAWDDRRRAVRALLIRPLITGDHPARVLIRRHRDWLALWFSHHVGWELHADADAARLVKRPPTIADASRPCRDPANKDTALGRRGYVFLCLCLGILTREGRQLTLKHLADQLNNIHQANPFYAEHSVPLALDDRPARRDLVHALRVLIDWGVLARVDGDDEQAFIQSEGADTLYAVRHPILSRLLATRQPPSLVTATDTDQRLTELLDGSALPTESEEWQTRQIRFRLFRRLLDDPVLYYRDLTPAERDYLDRQRTFILRQIETASGLVPEIRAEGIAMVDPTGDLSDYHLPQTGTDGHVTLLAATWLAGFLREDEAPVIPVAALREHIRSLAATHDHWRKDAREPGSEAALARDVIRRLSALGLLDVRTQPEPAVVPLPAIARYGIGQAAPNNTSEDQPAVAKPTQGALF